MAHERLEQAMPDTTLPQEPEGKWRVVANVAEKKVRDGVIAEGGTSYFRPGALVWIDRLSWGDGGERLAVQGVSRGGRVISVTLAAAYLANFRAKFAPMNLRMHQKCGLLYDTKGEAETRARVLTEKVTTDNVRKVAKGAERRQEAVE